MTRRLFWLLCITAITVGAFFIRLPNLEKRPMHTDEAVHAVKFGILLDTGVYEYDPHEYHGPTIYYMAKSVTDSMGITNYQALPDEVPLRLAVVCAGTFLVLLVACSRKFLGTREALWSALFFSVSPAFVFYSRYFIQEIPFVLFILATIIFLFAMFRTIAQAEFDRKHVALAGLYMVLAGMALGCTIATKETWIMVGGVAFCCGLLVYHINRYRFHLSRRRRYLGLIYTFNTGLIAVAAATLLLTNFGRNPDAAGMFEAVGIYVRRGIQGASSTFGDGIHNHPWYYYFKVLIAPDKLGKFFMTEGGIFLLGIFAIITIARKHRHIEPVWQFIALNTLCLTALYSLIPYKTPWNCLPFFVGWILLAGKGIAELLKFQHRNKIIRYGCYGIAVVLGLSWSAFSAHRSLLITDKFAADERVPYAYSPTSTNIIKAKTRAEEIAAVSPDGNAIHISVISPENDYWPLPWYLRRFPNVAYYTHTDDPAIQKSAIIMLNGEMEETIEKLGGNRKNDYFGLRPDVLFVALIRQELWDKFIEGVE